MYDGIGSRIVLKFGVFWPTCSYELSFDYLRNQKVLKTRSLLQLTADKKHIRKLFLKVSVFT